MTEALTASCTRSPTHYLVLRVPATGGSMQHAMACTIGLILCRDHAHEITPQAFLESGMADMAEQATQKFGLVPPDLGRAEFEVRRVGDTNWRQFLASRAASAGGGQA